MKTYGIIYIIHNEKQGNDVFKVGKSSRQVEERLSELNSDTSLIGHFVHKHSFLVNDIDNAEKKSHDALIPYRVQDNREFFKLDYDELKKKVYQATKDFMITYSDIVDANEEKDSVESSWYREKLKKRDEFND